MNKTTSSFTPKRYNIKAFSLLIVLSIILIYLHSCNNDNSDDLSNEPLPEYLDTTFYQLYLDCPNKNESIRYAESFITSVDTAIYHPLIADICDTLAEYYSESLFQISKAIDYSSKALETRVKLKDTDGIMRSKYKLAELYFTKGDYDNSYIYINQCKEYFLTKKDTAKILECYNILGALNHIAQEQEISREYLSEYLRLAREYNDTATLAKALNNVALSYITDTSKTIGLIKESIRLAETCKDSALLAKANINIATCYLAGGNTNNAEKALEKALPFLNNSDDWSRYFLSYGYIEYNKRNYETAIEYLLKSNEILEKTELTSTRQIVLMLLQNIYYQYGDYKKAYEWLYKYNNLVTMAHGQDVSVQMRMINDVNSINSLHKALNKAELTDFMEEIGRDRVKAVICISILLLLLCNIILVLILNLRKKQIKILRKESENKRLNTINELKDNEIKSINEILELNKLQQIHLEKQNEEIASRLQSLGQTIATPKAKAQINEMRNEILDRKDNIQWDEISKYITGTSSDFYKKLVTDFPDLTVNERRLCVLLNMNLTSKDIASLTKQSPHSINIARTRLRQKLGLTGDSISIQEFLSKYNS